MLSQLRKGASGWVAQLLITILVLSFGLWGISGFFNGFRADTVTTVGSVDITIPQFQRQYDVALTQLRQQTGQQITQDQARMFGLPQQVLGRLIADATLDDIASKFGLGISNETLARQIADDPAFAGPNGTFDRSYFNQLLRSNGLNEDQYIAERRGMYVRQQISDGLLGGTEVPEAYMRAVHEFRNEERNLSYLVLLPTLVGDVGEPSDTDLNTYYAANKATWKAPEYRAISVVRMAPTDLAKPADVSDDDARKQYDREIASFTTPEKRQVSQIVFKDRAEADQAAAALAGGKTFDDLLAERKIKPVDADLGLITREGIIDPKVAEAAFGLAPNSVSGVVEGQFGPAIVRVTTVQPKVVKTFDEAKGAIKETIADDRAAAEIADQRDVIEDARAAGDTLEEIAKKYGLKLVTIPAVDKNGNDAQGQPVKDLPGEKALLAAAFETDVGIANDPIALDKGLVWYDVTSVTAPRDRELKEVRDQVVAAWKRNKVDQLLTAKANEIRDRLAKGDDIAKIAADLKTDVKTAAKLTRSVPPPAGGDLSPPVVNAAFSGPKGTAAVANGTAHQSKIVLLVTDVNLPPYFSGTPDLEQGEEQLTHDIADDMMQQYIGQLQSQLRVVLNQSAIEQAIGASGS